MKSLRNRLLPLFLCLFGLLFLCSCKPLAINHSVDFQNGTLDSNAAQITIALAAGETSLLEEFPNLTSAILTGSADVAEVDAFAKAHPDIAVTCDLNLLGQTIPYSATSVTTSGEWDQASILDALTKLPYLSALDIRSCSLDNAALLALQKAAPTVSVHCMVSLFGEKTDNQTATLVVSDPSEEVAEIDTALTEALSLFSTLTSVDLTQLTIELSPETILALQQQHPTAEVLYTFHLFGREIKTTDTEVDLYEVRVKNEGVPALEQVLACLPDCTYADMANTKVDNETMASLAAKFPKIKFSWMIHFAAYSCRTDSNMLKASKPFYAYSSDVADVLKYCTDLEYMDIGHNALTDLSFLSNMKNLKVLIAAISYTITDVSPIANCTQLEYLELFSNRIVDVSPLANLKDLQYLNICNNSIVDASPLYSLKNLKRLWIANNPLSDEQKELLQQNLPNCEINFTTHNPTAEGWKKGARYELLTEQFHYGSPTIYERFGTYDHP